MTTYDTGAETPAEAGVILTRDLLLDDSLQRMVTRAAPGVQWWSEAERAHSLASTLALRPLPHDGVWLFAYGSLIWNPTIHFAERRVARIRGWHRAFCLATAAGRGTPENPGLVLGMDRGGTCTGCAFRIAEADVTAELAVLWRREMLAGSYVPRWLTVRALDGTPFARAIAFTIDRARPSYAGALTEAETVRRLATARGALGSGAEYLFRTRDGLRSLGLRDRTVEHLADQVAAAQAGAA
ncbi:MAG: gamma-glutamylcyclotransferase [Acidisphaera sp.]|nr:gamma-glutamylcyclotransferase [Acidisphaera sp.]